MEELLEERRGTCVYLTLNRPEKRNALNLSLVTALSTAAQDLADDENVRVVVFRGTGKVFSAGADLSELEEIQHASSEENLQVPQAFAGLIRVMIEHPKPLIACVNGHAIGGGCGLALACDFVLADREAHFGFPEVRIGFVPAVVAGLALRRLGESRTRDLLLSGRLVTADEAQQLGLATSAHESDGLAGAVDRLADMLARETSAAAVATTKRLIARLPALPLIDALNYGTKVNAEARQSPDFRAGVAAFLRKEPMPWQREFDEQVSSR